MACWLKFRAHNQKVAGLILTAVTVVPTNKMLNPGLFQGDCPVVSLL